MRLNSVAELLCKLIWETVTVSPSDDTSLLKVYKRVFHSHFQYFHNAIGHSNKVIVSRIWKNQGNGALKIASVRQPIHAANAVKKVMWLYLSATTIGLNIVLYILIQCVYYIPVW